LLVLSRIRRDRSGAFWIRVGAVAALTGVATQSVWETGLRMPANAVLFGLIAAIAVHEPRAGSAGATLSELRERLHRREPVTMPQSAVRAVRAERDRR
jgi:hypothetical protein